MARLRAADAERRAASGYGPDFLEAFARGLPPIVIINKIDPAILRSLTYDSPRFHDFKQRVQALPAPPPQKR